ncbi:MAG TPA: hypothetical protein VEX68_20785 [Bryobacteraceae bacterium]|nr:hypothetical protein [Bryobacteraceae bacterium]
MRKLLLTPLLVISFGFGETIEPAGAPPADLNPAIAGVLQKNGIRVLNDSKKVVSELWFRSNLPSGPKSAEDAVTLPTVPHGALLGVIRLPERGADRRGQTLKPGLYTLRFSFHPQNGDHQGVEPQRDFLVLSPAADDKDPNANIGFDALMEQSRKASSTPHPAVLSFWKSEAGTKPGIGAGAEGEWVLQAKIGDQPVSVIVVGKNAH